MAKTGGKSAWVAEQFLLFSVLALEKGYANPADWAEIMGLDPLVFENISQGRLVNPNVFALLHQHSGLFDPRDIPDEKRSGITHIRRWNNARYEEWLKGQVTHDESEGEDALNKEGAVDTTVEDVTTKVVEEADYAEEARQIKAKSEAWARDLSQAVSDWCDRNHYRYKSNLADELGLTPSQLGHIIKADSISRDQELHARLFVRTGLKESDPRLVPDGYKITRGRLVRVKRAMDPAVFEQWYRREGYKWEKPQQPSLSSLVEPILSEGGPIDSKDVPPSVSSEQLQFLSQKLDKALSELEEMKQQRSVPSDPLGGLGQLVGGWFGTNILVPLIREELSNLLPRAPIEGAMDRQDNVHEELEVALEEVRILRTQLEQVRQSSYSDIGAVAKQLKNLLDPYLKGDAQMRDDLRARFGKELHDLFLAVNPFSLPRKDGEELIRTRKEFSD